jgi:hypothetical protein
VDGNGTVNVEDAKTILKYLTGGVASLPLPKEG